MNRAARRCSRWRDILLYGEPTGDPLPAAPVFSNIGAVVGTIGTITRFRQLRELIVASPGYTEAIGEDLMMVGSEETPVPEGLMVPDLKITVSTGYQVTVKASLQGNDQLRVEYSPNGSSAWTIVGEPTTTPFTFTVTPQTPGQPESGHVRAILRKKNVNVGNYSPEYPITLS